MDCGVLTPPAPTVLASGQNGATGITVDANNVYWVAPGVVMEVPIGGGTAVTLASAQQPGDVKVNATTVYWSLELNAGIYSVPIDGGSVSPNLEQGNNFTNIDATELILTSADIYFGGGNTGVAYIPLGGGVPQPVGGGQPGAPFELASDANNVYFTAKNGAGEVAYVSLSTGQPTVLVYDGAVTPRGVAVDSTYVYWLDQAGGTVNRVPIAGGTSTTLATGQASPTGLAYDSGNLYWTNYVANGSVMKMPAVGGCMQPIATSQGLPYHIVVDATSVYWTTSGDGTVMSAPK